MNAFKKPPTAIIAPGAGADLADVYVERLLDSWLASLQVQTDFFDDKIKQYFQETHGCNGIGMNPTAQERWAKRTRIAFGDSLLLLDLFPGKRGEFAVSLDTWTLGPSLYSIAATQSIDGKAVWIYGVRYWARRLQRGREFNRGSKVMMALSRHSLVRLIQRGSCHTVDDITSCLRAAWPRLSFFELATRKAIDEFHASHWFWPLRIPTMKEPIVALCFMADGSERKIPAVKTFLRLDMLTPEMKEAVLATDELIGDKRSLTVFGMSTFGAVERMTEKVRID